MYHMLIVLFFTLISTTIISMDTDDTSKPKKRRVSDNLSFSRRSRSDDNTGKRKSCHFPTKPIKPKANSDEKKRTDKSQLPTIKEAPSALHGFLIAARENKIEQVKFYLKNQHLPINDIKDQWHNRAIHLASLNAHFETIDLLLGDPRTKTCITNVYGSFPQELLKNHEDGAGLELRQKILRYSQLIFAHTTLNMNVQTYASKIYASYNSGNIDEKTLAGTVATIKRKINDDTKTQSTELPLDAQLPTYATDEFIMGMLNYELALLSTPRR